MLEYDHRAVFLDTNVYLHYQSFEQVDWRRLLSTERVTLHVPAVIVNELDKHKDEHPIRRIRKRAANVSAKLFEYFESQKPDVRPGVTLKFSPFDPQVDFTRHNLNPVRQDDQLLAAVLQLLEQQPGVQAVVVTNDFNLLMKAKSLGIEARRMPDMFKLPEEPDAEEKRNRELMEELNRVRKAAAPNLRICFGSTGEDHCAFKLAFPEGILSPIILGLQYFLLKQRYPPVPPPDKVISFSGREKSTKAAGEHKQLEQATETLATFNEMMSQFHPLEVERYNRELKDFFSAYEQYLRDSIEYKNRWTRTLRLEVQLVNDGTYPAEDIDVALDFPEGVTLLAEGSLPPPPVEPLPPSPPQTFGVQTGELIADGLRKLVNLIKPRRSQQLAASALSARAIRTPDVQIMAGGRRAEFKVLKLKHTQRTRAVTLYALFSSFDVAGSFTIPYRAVAANVPQPVTGCLHVKVEKFEPPVASRPHRRKTSRRKNLS